MGATRPRWLLHDVLVYRDGAWRNFASPSPWVTDDDRENHTGFYEDRMGFRLDDGSVRGFEEFGGWLTVHTGMRTTPGEVSDAVDSLIRSLLLCPPETLNR